MPSELTPDELQREAEAAERAAAVQELWGHPRERWHALIARVQNNSVTDFDAVQEEWLALMWCLDQYRIADAPPEGMGNPDLKYQGRMDGIYRGKGNWFATVLTLYSTTAPVRRCVAAPRSRASRRTIRSISRGRTAMRRRLSARRASSPVDPRTALRPAAARWMIGPTAGAS